MSVIARVKSSKNILRKLIKYCYAVNADENTYTVYSSNLALAYLGYELSKSNISMFYQIVDINPDTDYVLEKFKDISLSGERGIFPLFVTYNSTFIEVLYIYFHSKNIVSFYNKIKNRSELIANAKYLLQSISHTNFKFSFNNIMEYVSKNPDKCIKFIRFYEGIILNSGVRELKAKFTLKLLEIYGDEILDYLINGMITTIAKK